MKKYILIAVTLMFVSCSVCAQTRQNSTQIKEITMLQHKVDSLQNKITEMTYEHQKIQDAQTVIAKRLIETREDYTNFISHVHSFIGWIIAIIVFIVAVIAGALGVAFPLWSNHDTNKQVQKALKKSEHLLNQINSVRTKVNQIQGKIETSERNARESQKQAMISRLFSEAIKSDDSNEAIELYNKILQIDKDNVDALINKAIELAKSDRNLDAIKDASLAIDLSPKRHNGYAVRGVAYMNLKKYEQAIQDFTQILILKPDDYKTYLMRACAYIEYNKWAEAIADFDKAAEYNELDAESYNNRAFSYYNIRKLELAMGDINLSLAKNPKHAEAYDTRGCIYLAMGKDKYQMALEDFTKAISINPKLWECYENRANLYKLLSEDETDEVKKVEYIDLYKKDLEIFRTKKLPEDKIEETEQTENEAE